jgi:beta-galactosidase
MKLGVCYYPEHWPEAKWADDARDMAAVGLSRVRIAEFAWSRIEPEPGRFDWGWLDRAVDTLAAAGLEVVMCTPTATPPKWLIDRRPDILAVDARGQPRRFGSRRHYCFSSETYRRESRRISEAVAQRYGRHPAVCAWQTDNEYGCHDTVESWSANAAEAFRLWLKARHGDVAALNRAWGNVFWSMEYRSFEEVDLPSQTVTEANPAHRLDFQRFSSAQVGSFNREQVAILREHSPGRDVVHNFMGAFAAFDHFETAKDLDVATWDSYPLGFLEQGKWSNETKLRFMRQGHPDFTAFHHDLYRGVGRGRWWVMEQQPGPVNWGPWNPAPLPGMVRAWTLEAFAHGAEVVSYFRWRQAPFAQEQMHAGLQTPDGDAAPAMEEARQVAAELAHLGGSPTRQAAVALVFDYQAKWLFDIQPQGRDFDYMELALEWYGAARRLGWDVDIVSPDADLQGYQIVLAPSLPMCSDELAARLADVKGAVVLGPRSGSKTEAFQIPPGMAPGALAALTGVRVHRVESLRPGHVETGDFPVARWLEHASGEAAPLAATAAGAGLWWRKGRAHYLACWPPAALLDRILRTAGGETGLELLDLPQDLRLRRRGDLRVAVNYGPEALSLADHIPGRLDYCLGGDRLGPAEVAIWREVRG